MFIFFVVPVYQSQKSHKGVVELTSELSIVNKLSDSFTVLEVKLRRVLIRLNASCAAPAPGFALHRVVFNRTLRVTIFALCVHFLSLQQIKFAVFYSLIKFNLIFNLKEHINRKGQSWQQR